MSSLPVREHLARWLSEPALLLAASIFILCTALQFAGLEFALRFDRSAIEQGEYWRLISGNFVHLGLGHTVMNMAGFVLIVQLCWHYFAAWEWALILVVACLFVTLGLYRLNPEVLWYVGLSGVLHGLLVAGCLADLRDYPRQALALLTLVAAKILWEQTSGSVPGSASLAGGNVVVDAHLYGAVGGAVMGLLLIGSRRLSRSAG